MFVALWGYRATSQRHKATHFGPSVRVLVLLRQPEHHLRGKILAGKGRSVGLSFAISHYLGFLQFAVILTVGQSALLKALDPEKALTQYTRTVWTQADGLPQDVVRAITQTPDGYLWLGTTEGLARFDGYEFVVFTKDRDELPSNSVLSLAAGPAGELWIGTSSGLAHYLNDRPYETFTKANGLPDDEVSQVVRDHNGAVWVVVGSYLCRLKYGEITKFQPGVNLPLVGVRAVYEDRENHVWAAGYGAVVRLVTGDQFVSVTQRISSNGGPIISLLRDHRGNLWMGSNRLRILSPDGRLTVYSTVNGIPDRPIRSLCEDKDGNIWLGTDNGLSRFSNGRFEALADGSANIRDRVRGLYEDSEGNLWVGMNTGLSRFRDDPFIVYSKAEGFPSNQPTTVHQDQEGHIWVGFQNAGILCLDETKKYVYNAANGLPDNEIFAIRNLSRGGLIIAGRGGLSRFRLGRFTTFAPSRKLNHQLIYDALEDTKGRTWIVSDDGLSRLVGTQFVNVIPGGLNTKEFMIVLCEGAGATLWAGSRGNGLWSVDNGHVRHFTTADGLSSDQIRALTQSPDGTLWIGTLGGGLNSFRNGSFQRYTSRQGLLSDNIFSIVDDCRGSLWLSTTRGLSKVCKRDLQNLTDGEVTSISSVNYGIEDGLRNPQCASGSVSCRAVVTADGRFWLPTGRGVAVFMPGGTKRQAAAPQMHLAEVTAMSRPVNVSHKALLTADTTDIQLRYAGIHLSAPEAVTYSYRLEGVDKEWVSAGKRRTINYTNLRFGQYRFRVKGELKNGLASEASYEFEILPHLYETSAFRWFVALTLIGLSGLAYHLHLRRIRGRFMLILQERARIAREIHDTLAQGFVGISSQLDAVSMCLKSEPQAAQEFLDLARKMTRYSLSEARRSVADLRASALEGKSLAAALELEVRRWTAGSNVQVHTELCRHSARLSHEIEQNLLRIAQEAVTNTLKHSGATELWIRLSIEVQVLRLCIADDGCGCSRPDLSRSVDGHFGMIGMRERAESIGGQFQFKSSSENGTSVEVTVPLARRN